MKKKVVFSLSAEVDKNGSLSTDMHIEGDPAAMIALIALALRATTRQGNNDVDFALRQGVKAFDTVNDKHPEKTLRLLLDGTI